MSKSVFDVLRMLRDMDSLQVERHPLPDHYAVRCDNHCRELYATMLAAMLLASGEVSDNESRLYKLLLNSLKLGDNHAKFFELAQSINKDKLREFLRVADEHKLAQSFFMDALVLCRLDAPMTDARSRLLSQWVDLLKLDVQNLPYYAHLAALAIGLPTSTKLPERWDDSYYCVWDEFAGASELTAKVLKAGVDGGRWRLSKSLHLSHGWSIKNAVVRFENDAVLHTATKGGNVTITGCEFEGPVIKVEGVDKFAMAGSKAYSKHLDTSKITAFELIAINCVEVKDCYFNTQGARAFKTIMLKSSTPQFSNCEFVSCGCKLLKGGALFAHMFYVDKCTFKDCVAIIGGGIMSNFMSDYDGYIDTQIKSSAFHNCRSLFYDDVNMGGGFFACTLGSGRIITGSHFNKSGLRLSQGSVSKIMIDSTSIIDSSVRGIDSHQRSDNCNLSNCDWYYNGYGGSYDGITNELFEWFISELDDEINTHLEKKKRSIFQ